MITDQPQSRKHQPTGSRMLRPRLGWLTASMLLGLAVVQWAAAPSDDPWLAQPWSHAWLATMWGGWATAVWILVRPPLNLWRLLAIAALLTWHCGVLQMVRHQPATRYLILFGGYGVVQSIVSLLLRLPRWKRPRAVGTGSAKAELSPESPSSEEPQAEDRPAELAPADPASGREPLPGQFGILSILLLMTSVAVVLWAIRQYGDAGGEHFLSGSVVLALLLLTLIAATAIAAATARRGALLFLPLMILVAAASASVMAAQELAIGGRADYQTYWRTYFMIEAAFGLIIYGVGTCGRIDAAR